MKLYPTDLSSPEMLLYYVLLLSTFLNLSGPWHNFCAV